MSAQREVVTIGAYQRVYQRKSHQIPASAGQSPPWTVCTATFKEPLYMHACVCTFWNQVVHAVHISLSLLINKGKTTQRAPLMLKIHPKSPVRSIHSEQPKNPVFLGQ